MVRWMAHTLYYSRSESWIITKMLYCSTVLDSALPQESPRASKHLQSSAKTRTGRPGKWHSISGWFRDNDQCRDPGASGSQGISELERSKSM